MSTSGSPEAKLTGGQRWIIAGLIVLQIPASVIFYPLAALFALTGIGVPLALLFMGVGTMPYSVAMKQKETWRSGARASMAAGPQAA